MDFENYAQPDYWEHRSPDSFVETLFDKITLPEQFKNVDKKLVNEFITKKIKIERLSLREEVKDHLVDITPDDIVIMENVKNVLRNFLKEFGGNPKKVDEIAINIVKQDSVFAISKGKLGGGYASPITQAVVVERDKTDIVFANNFLHEFWHLVTYQDAELKMRGDYLVLLPRKAGVCDHIKDDEGNMQKYLIDLEEALISQVQKRAERFILKEQANGTTREWESKKLEKLITSIYQQEKPEIEFSKYKKDFVDYLIRMQVQGDISPFKERLEKAFPENKNVVSEFEEEFSYTSRKK